MPKIVDLLGRKVGKLIVIEKLGSRSSGKIGKTDVYWKCKCECGNFKDIPTAHLTKNNTKSCGCLISENARKTIKFAHKTNTLPKGEAALNDIISVYKRTAIKRNLSFNLTKTQCKTLFSSNCNYCNSKPSNISKYHKEEIFIYNGIDRLDNNLGYELQNVVSCCKICNWMKVDMSKDDFLEHITKIHLWNESLELKEDD